MSERVVMTVIGLIDGQRTAFDGQYVVEFNASRDGVEPGTGRPMTMLLLTTPDLAKATRFTVEEAFELWRSVDQRNPVRADGKPNRPFTSFHVVFNKEAADED